MRVAIVLNFPPEDHRLVYPRGIAEKLAKRGHDVSLILQEGPESSESGEGELYQVHQLGGDTYSILGQAQFMLRLFFHLLRSKAEVIHGRNPFSSVIPAIVLRKLLRPQCSVVYDARGLWIISAYLKDRIGSATSRLLSALEDYATREADRVIAISPRMRDWLQERGVDPGKIDVVLGDGVDLDLFSNASRSRHEEGVWRLGYIGSISESRGIPEILQAFRIVRDSISEKSVLIFIGPSDETVSSIHQLVRSLNLSEWVQLKDPVSHDEALRQMGKLDLALSYDAKGSLPLEVAVHTKIFEYMAAGVPIVATRHPANEAILRDGVDAMLTEESPLDFAEGILQLIRNPALGKELSENALKTVIMHDFAKKAELVEQTYTRSLSDQVLLPANA